MPRGFQLRLNDMVEAINGIEGVIAGAEFDAFVSNWGMQRAVERGLEIISEASRHLPSDLTALEPAIPWRQTAAIGNLLRHEYQRADPSAVWNIVQLHLPALKAAVERLRKQENLEDRR